MYCIQHCFICRPSDSTVSEDAGIEPRTLATSALSVNVCSMPLCGRAWGTALVWAEGYWWPVPPPVPVIAGSQQIYIIPIIFCLVLHEVSGVCIDILNFAWICSKDSPPTPSLPGECVPPRLWCRGRTHSLGGEGVGGGSIVRKTPDTALYSIYVLSTLWWVHLVLKFTCSWRAKTTCLA